MFGIGVPELLLILIIGLVVFGPGKLPEIGRALGKTIKEFKAVSSNISAEINAPAQPKPVRPAPPAPETASIDATETVQPTTTTASSLVDEKKT